MDDTAPSTPPDRVVVVGAGLAGLRTLAELRAQGFEGALTWLGAEGVPAYDRPPLSKELLSRPDPVWLAEDLGHDPAALADVVDLDRPAVGLRAGDGELAVVTERGEVAADAVVVATGSAPVRPWPTALALHDLDDARRLRRSLLPGRRVVIVGAGWIGAEVAGVAAAAGALVTVVEAGAEPLWRQLGRDAGARTRGWFADAGVELRTGATVDAVGADAVRLADGTVFAADVVLAAVGVRPRTAWLGTAVPVLPSGHLRTGRTGRTATPGVWAVGDVAMRDSVHFGPVPGGHWFAALRDPALLAADVMGHEVPATEPAPEVFSDQLGHHLEVVGRLVADDEPRAHRVLRSAGHGWTELQLVGDVLHGAVVADVPKEVAAVRRLLRGAALPRLDLERAADGPLRDAVRG